METETKTDNELIAEFMGEEVFLYNEWWDQLMRVVEKIDQLYHVAFPGNEEFIRRLLSKEELLDGPYMNVIALPLATPINEVYQAVLEFIKWYNNQKENGNRNS